MSSTGNNTNGAVSVPPGKMITLKTADGNLFDVEESIAMEFVTVKTFFDDDGDEKTGTVVPLPNVSAKYLSLIIQYCKEQLKFQAESTPQEAKKAYEAKFVEELGDEDLKEMILAVNYLNIKSFLDMLNQAVAERIKNWSVKRVREFFGVENDFTPDEEDRIRQEHPWAHENVED